MGEKAIAKQIKDLAERIDRLEEMLGNEATEPAGDVAGVDEPNYFCSLPEVPEREFAPDVSPGRARLIRYVSKKWVNGTKLRYYFFGTGRYAGDANQKRRVREGFKVWEDLGIGISFEEVASIADAEVRIGFLRGDGSWSYVGRDVVDIPGQYERTMNFGWDLTRDPRGVDTPVHEIGHTLGFPHEHQNPFAGIVWDENAVYRYFGGSPNFWPRETTFHNVLRKLPEASVEGSNWDPNSIMHYGFPAGLIVAPAEYRNGLRPELGLSERDIEQVRQFYPPLNDATNTRLRPLKLELLSIGPAEQRNFAIEPDETREYTIQTFGQSDTVMVLFEDVNGDHQYLAGDDDSGNSRNAKIKLWLNRGKRYVLRIRMCLNYASGDSAVMMW